ncbi:CCHC-type domain-containing protein [Nephila pilipes]|uniref:CCHC-type domain-containing protein n=1 Tax=Nephila pilipes TaxID=299642 RepID=A0A8X6NGB8_NEPPI|nr:CCHC-type domain-containing protein [Nephila pilipes]
MGKPSITKPECPNCKQTANEESANFTNISLHSCSSTPDKNNFQKIRLCVSLADGHKSRVEIYTTSVVIRLEGSVVCTLLIALSYAEGNRTLWVMDFLQKAGIILNQKHRNWFFSDSPHRTYDFVKEVIIQSRPNLEENTCLLHNDEGKCLTPEQKNELELDPSKV